MINNSPKYIPNQNNNNDSNNNAPISNQGNYQANNINILTQEQISHLPKDSFIDSPSLTVTYCGESKDKQGNSKGHGYMTFKLDLSNPDELNVYQNKLNWYKNKFLPSLNPNTMKAPTLEEFENKFFVKSKKNYNLVYFKFFFKNTFYQDINVTVNGNPSSINISEYGREFANYRASFKYKINVFISKPSELNGFQNISLWHNLKYNPNVNKFDLNLQEPHSNASNHNQNNTTYNQNFTNNNAINHQQKESE